MSKVFTFDVFLSHNEKDKPRVRLLADRLKAAGLRVWFDEWAIKVGEDIQLAVEHGLEDSRTVVLCMSPAAFGSDWVTAERSTTLFRDPTNKDRRFKPVLLEDCTIPDTYRRFKYVDLRADSEAAYDELIAALRPEAPYEPPAEPEPDGAYRLFGMRLRSTEASVKAGEVSLLAVLETLAAVFLVFYLSLYFNTLGWLAMAASVAPLLLLRTDTSIRRAIEWWDAADNCQVKAERWIRDRGQPILFITFAPFSIVMVFYVWIVPLSVRVAATLLSALASPVDALKAVPRNWSRVTLGMDICCPPELIPDHPKETLANFLSESPPPDQYIARFLVKWLWMFGLIMFLPAYAYRWSLKATSIIYSPLVLVAMTTFRRIDDVRKELLLFVRSDLTRLAAAYSVVIIIAFLAKIVLMMTVAAFVDWWNEHPAFQFLAIYVAPAEVPPWQVTSFVNAWLCLGVFFFARAALLHIETGVPWSENMIKGILRVTTFFRWTLTIYTILCTGYITLQAAQNWDLPRLGTKIFPWL